jgi:hypothetical protein
VGIIVHGKRHDGLKILCDDGSNCHLLSEQAAAAMGVKVFDRDLSLTTSNGFGTKIRGVSEPITVEYGQGHSAIREKHCFLVVRNMSPLYSVLLGHLDFNKHFGLLDAYEQTYILRPRGQAPVILPTTMRG